MSSLTLLGTGTCQIEFERRASSVLLELNGTPLLFDCGHGIVQRLLEVGVRHNEINHIVVSHFHPDHVSDLIPLLQAGAWSRRDPRTSDLHIYGPPGVQDLIDGLSNLFGERSFRQPSYNILVSEVKGEQFQIGPPYIPPGPKDSGEQPRWRDGLGPAPYIPPGPKDSGEQPRWRDGLGPAPCIPPGPKDSGEQPRWRDGLGPHIFDFVDLPPAGNHGLRFSWNGKRYAITGDSDFHEAEVAFLRDVDLAIIDSGHIEDAEIVQLAVESQAKTIVCSHLYREIDAGRLQILAEDAGYQGTIVVGRDLMTFVL